VSIPPQSYPIYLSGSGEALLELMTETLNFNSALETSCQWFAAHTFSCQEKRIAQHLSTREIEYFLPLSRNLRRWKNGCTMLVEQPLFPGYLFVKIPRNDRLRVLELPGVHSIVGTGREPIPLPSLEIETLRQSIGLLQAEPCPFLNVGERVWVRRGPLAGMSGIVVRKKNGMRLILSLDLIMKSVSVEIDALDLEAVGPLAQVPNLVGASPTHGINTSFSVTQGSF